MSRQLFDPQALYDAIDARRREQGMTWKDLSNELMVSTSTIKSIAKRRFGFEMDGVLGMCLWLGRSMESFAGGDGGTPPKHDTFRRNGRFPRFDKKALYAAINAERERRGVTWDQVAQEIWPSRARGGEQLRRLKGGGRAEVFSTLAICAWLRRPVHSFLRETFD